MTNSHQQVQSDMYQWISNLNKHKDAAFALVDKVGGASNSADRQALQKELYGWIHKLNEYKDQGFEFADSFARFSANSAEREKTTPDRVETMGEKLPDLGKLKAAPFVEGPGCDTVGGRGHPLVVPANNDELAEAWASDKPLRILPNFCEHIQRDKRITSGGPYKTLYGQTAPGDGIRFGKPKREDRAPLDADHNELIIQHAKFSPGKESDGSDGVKIQPHLVRGLNINSNGYRSVENVVAYHCSLSHAPDQANSVWYKTKGVAFWGCIFGQPLNHNGHGYNFLAGDKVTSIGVNRCLFGQGKQRNPQFQMWVDSYVQMANNIISGFGRGTLLRARAPIHARFDVENNLFRRATFTVSGWGEIEFGEENNGTISVYLSGNFALEANQNMQSNFDKLRETRYSSYPKGTYNSKEHVIRPGAFSSKRHGPVVKLINIADLEDNVLTKAGACFGRRDDIDQLIIDSYGTNAGFVEDFEKPIMNDGPSRIDDSRADKVPAWFLQKYDIDPATDCLTTDDGNGEGWTLFDQAMYALESAA